MRSLKDLGADALKIALTASATLMEHKAYMPRGGLLVMLLGRYRDDVREALDMEAEDIPGAAKSTARSTR